MNSHTFYRRLLVGTALTLGMGLWVGLTWAAEKPLKTDSRAPHIHRIPLYDENSQAINPKDPKAKPYSPAGTCGKCHEYNEISTGWHFNAGNGAVTPGRPGEPWLLVDAATRTQIPLSYRGWKGTWRPIDLGVSDWTFVQAFGRQMPGGGIAEPKLDSPAATQPSAGVKPRWHISGQLNIDCMICHAADQSYDFNDRAAQLTAENYALAPSIAAGLGTVTGKVKASKSLPKDWNAKEAEDPDSGMDPLPGIKYHIEGDHTLMPVVRTPNSDRCYTCHTVQPDVDRLQYWHSDRDIHTRAGMSCSNCHRNGIDHNTVRGYETEAAERKDTSIASLSCRGCHLGTESASMPAKLGGRWGAPRPEHKGLPAIHMEKLSCTACHSGNWPGNEPQAVQTAMGHALGITRPNREAGALPRIVQPIFLRGQDGKLTPHRMVWPNFWAKIEGGKVIPLQPTAVKGALMGKIPAAVENTADGAKPLDEKQIAEALEALAKAKAGEYAYVSGGRLYKRTGTGTVSSEEHEAAKAYAWPLAHDVRPAQQSLGARGCADCHSTDAPIYFASVKPIGPAAGVEGKAMHAVRGEDGTVPKLFAMSFVFRPMLKIVSFSCAAVILGVMVLYGFRGLNFVMTKGRNN